MSKRGFIQRHPRILGFISLAVIAFPQWASAVWSLFYSEPLGVVFARRLRKMNMLPFSPSWITIPAGASMLAIICVNLWREAHKKAPNVRLTPTSGPRPDVLLAVTNQGARREFYAQCTPVALRNSPNELARGTFDLKWEHTFGKRVSIGAGASCNLLIATADNDHRNALTTMQIWGLSGGEKKQCEWSRWSTDAREKLPEYDLEICIFSDGTKGPFSERFILRPKTWYGPLEMVKISERSADLRS